MAFFEGCPVGWGGVPTGAGLVDGGGRPRALIPGEGVREGLKAEHPPTKLAWWTGGQGGGARARGVVQGLRFRGGEVVGARAPRTEQISQRVQKEEKWLFLKDALIPREGVREGLVSYFLLFLTRTTVGWGGGTHRSWPGGQGGRPRALILGEGLGKGWLQKGSHGAGGQGGGARARGGGARASVAGG